jgi:hypothetical protein
MRQVLLWLASLAVWVALSGPPVAVAGPGDGIPPAVSWAGVVADPALEAKAPAGGLIGTQQAFADLWKAWGLPDPAPDIDFNGYFVVVATTPKHMTRVMLLNVGRGGDGALVRGREAKERQGFGYGLAVFPRVVKTVGGKEIPK